MEWEQVAIAALSGGTISGVLETMRFLLKRADRKTQQVHRDHWLRALSEKRELLNILNRLASDTPADRAMITKLSNGGEMPTCGSMWSTIVDESGNGRLPRAGDKWRNVPIDPESREICARAIQVGSVTMDVDSMSGQAGAFLASQGVAYAELYFLCHVKGASYFLALNFCEPRHKLALGALYADEIRQAMIRVSEIVKHSHKVAGRA